MKKMNLTQYINTLSGIIMLAVVWACHSENVIDTPEGNAPVDSILEKCFVLSATDYYVGDWYEGTRALTAVKDVLQKQIHNVYYFFYDKNGYLEKIFYQGLESPKMELEVNLSDFKDEGKNIITPDGKVLLIVNSQSMSTANTPDDKPVLVSSDKTHVGNIDLWRQVVPTVNDFKNESWFPLYFQNAQGIQGGVKQHGKPDHIIMYGYFDGTLDNSHMQVPLGRIVARLRFALSGDGLGPQARITVKNIPVQTAIYPEAVTKYKTDVQNNKDGAYWYTYQEMIDNGSSADNGWDSNTDTYLNVGADKLRGGIIGTEAGKYTGSVIYYCGENNYYLTGVKSYVYIETWDERIPATNTSDFQVARGTCFDEGKNDEPNRVYKMVLAHDPPEITDNDPNADRDYTLYYNTSYTFNLTLKKEASNAKEHTTRTAEPNKDGSITLYPIE